MSAVNTYPTYGYRAVQLTAISIQSVTWVGKTEEQMYTRVRKMKHFKSIN